MYACFGLIHLLHTESTRSQTLCQLSQRGVRLHRQLSQRGVRLHDNSVNAEYTNSYEDFIILP
jgi:hypothetical protein